MPTTGPIDSYDDVVTHSNFSNLDIAPLDRKDLQQGIQQTDKKLIGEIQKKEAEKKYYKDHQVSFDSKSSPKIDTGALPSVPATIEFFEGLNKPQLPQPKLSPLPQPKKEVTRAPMSMQKTEPTSTALVKSSEAEMAVAEPTEAVAFAAQAKNFFAGWFDWINFDWLTNPINYLLTGKESAEEDLSKLASLTPCCPEKLAEYIAQLARLCEEMRESSKADDEKKSEEKGEAIYQVALWIKLIMKQILYQEQRLKEISEFVSFKQDRVQEAQKKHARISESMHDNEKRQKTLAWINKGTTAAQWTAGILSAGLLVASFATPAGAITAFAAFTGAVGVFGGLASVVDGATRCSRANLDYDLDVMNAQMGEWSHQDDANNQEIEELMKDLTAALKTIQNHWAQLEQIERSQNATMKMLQSR